MPPDYLSAIIIFGVAIVLMLLCAVFKPVIHIKCGKINFGLETFWIFPFIAAIIVVSAQIIEPKEAAKGLWSFSGLNPIGILILFFSMVYISKFLDTTGFFEFTAIYSLSKAGNSSTKLYFIIYAVVSVLTIFTSNDVVILTFTPFIHYFAKMAKISPIPFLFGEFFAANTWSMIFIISNPTNVVLGTAFHQSFGQFAKIMAPSSFVGGVSNCIMLYILFKDSISKDFTLTGNLGDPWLRINSKVDMIVSLVFILICIILLAVSSAPGFPFEMWVAAGIMALILLVYNIVIDIINCNNQHKVIIKIKNDTVESTKKQNMNELEEIPTGTEANEETTTELVKVRPSKLKQIFSTLPYPIIPFLLSLFILVNTLKQRGFFDMLGEKLGPISVSSNACSVILFGLISTISANILNNIPMSVAFAPIIQATTANPNLGSVYASVVGANIGANLTPLGALAGLMWLKILKEDNISIGFLDFLKVGIVVTPICLALTAATVTGMSYLL